MNIKKTLSKVLACSLILASTLTTGMPSVKANAKEATNKWKTLVLICPKVDIQKNAYTDAASTRMNEKEISTIKSDAGWIDHIIGGSRMEADIKVSEIPITNVEVSMAKGRSVVLDDILDKYAPKGYYDSIIVIYRNKDGSTDLATNTETILPKNGHTNGAILSTIKLDNANHDMTYYSLYNSFFIIDTLASSFYSYFTSEGFNLWKPQEVDINSPTSDPNIYALTQKRYYGYFFAGLALGGAEGTPGVTKEMWAHRPSTIE